MGKKESLWDLLKRLDEQAAQFNSYLSEINRYFDTAAKKTRSLLDMQEKELHKTISKVRRVLKTFMKQKNAKDKH